MDLPRLLPRAWSICLRWLLGYVRLPSSHFFYFLYETAEIYYFKPVSSIMLSTFGLLVSSHRRQQTVLVSLMFLGIVSYVLGLAMETFIPRHGLFRYLNPVSSNHTRISSISPLCSILSTRRRMLSLSSWPVQRQTPPWRRKSLPSSACTTTSHLTQGLPSSCCFPVSSLVTVLVVY